MYVFGYTCHMLTWSLWSRSDDSYTWPLDVLMTTDCAHVQKTFVWLSRMNELWERCNKSRGHKNIDDSFDFCHHLPTVVLN